MYKKTMLAVMLMMAMAVNANNIQVSGISFNTSNSTLTFTISWENSWRVSTAPNNWDAAWVFIKRRNCADQFWKHQFLSASGHTAASPLQVQTVPDSMGVFLRRSANGSGNIAATTVTLKLGAIPAPLAEWDFKVYAIEMVYVPEGAFYLGSGGNSYYEFCEGGGTTPFKVTSENALSFANTAGNLYSLGGIYNPSGNAISAAFPKGYRAFYAMKYEISQGQYTDFLNSLPQDMAQARQSLPAGNFRNTLSGLWPSYTCTTPNRAMNYLNWASVCAYMDWSGLAPMSEMEYEKLCRGVSVPVTNEYAWGTNTISRANTVVNDGTAQEAVSDVITTGSGLCNYGGNSGGLQGPLRSGFAAKPSTGRFESGAGYYGNMELTGNVYEYCVGVFGTAATVFDWSAHGDGQLAFGNGTSNVTGWYNQAATTNIGPGTGATLKGGAWSNRLLVNGEEQPLRVSDRLYSNNAYGNSDNGTGGRGVRRLFN